MQKKPMGFYVFSIFVLLFGRAIMPGEAVNCERNPDHPQCDGGDDPVYWYQALYTSPGVEENIGDTGPFVADITVHHDNSGPYSDLKGNPGFLFTLPSSFSDFFNDGPDGPYYSQELSSEVCFPDEDDEKDGIQVWAQDGTWYRVGVEEDDGSNVCSVVTTVRVLGWGKNKKGNDIEVAYILYFVGDREITELSECEMLPFGPGESQSWNSLSLYKVDAGTTTTRGGANCGCGPDACGEDIFPLGMTLTEEQPVP